MVRGTKLDEYGRIGRMGSKDPYILAKARKNLSKKVVIV